MAVRTMKVIVSMVASAVLAAVCALPANATQLHDSNADVSTLRSQSVAGVESNATAMPDNPSMELPDSIASNIPDDAEVVSEGHALTSDGELKNLETGITVTDPKLVGTRNTQPDPLAKTDGESFIPVEAGTVKRKVDAVVTTPNITADFMGKTFVHTASLPNNEYGAHWGTYNGTSAFFESDNTLFAQQAKGVIDVSEWQGDINWQAVKNAGVEGAIIRLSYGWGNGYDQKALHNISECKRLGIPFGIYTYSYAETSGNGSSEGADTVSLLRKAGVSPSDLKYPVYYDLEAWSWTGHAHPTSPSVYDGLVNAWFNQLRNAGYTNLAVYSYTSYLNNELNSSNIHAKTHWVAQYGSRMGYTAWPGNDRGWQYSASAHIGGISGNVDVSAFGNKTYKPVIDANAMARITVPDGVYYINSGAKDSSSVEIGSGSTDNGARAQLWQGNRSAAQQFRFTRQSDGSYVIANVNSGKVLDVASGAAKNGAVVQQYDANGSKAQRWFVRDSGSGYYLQSALGNWVLDICGGSTANGTLTQLYMPNGTATQKFILAAADAGVPVDTPVRISSAANGGMVMDIPGGSSANGERVQLYQWNGSAAQQYRFHETGNGTYTITNVKTGKVLDVAGGNTGNGGVVQQYSANGSSAQRWVIRNYGNGKLTFVSVKAGKAIDVPSGSVVSGAKLQTYTVNGSVAQQWTVYKPESLRDRLNALAKANKGVLADGAHRFTLRKGSSKVLDVNGGSRANGANVQLYVWNGSNAQRWKVSHDATGYVTLTNVGSGKVLDVNGASTANGANVQQYASNGSYAQKWIAVGNSDGSVTLRSALAENLVIDVAGGSTANGANVQLYASNGSAAQKWTVQ